MFLMEQHIFEQKINELVEEIGCIPEKNSKNSIFSHKNKNIKRSYPEKLRDIRDSLDSLRVSIKYLLFDLEATSRENTYLRQLLDGRDEAD